MDYDVDASALAFRDICYSVKVPGKRDKLFRKIEPDTEKVILNNVNGVFGKGELIAIMGPSGAGKTSLLEILADRCKPSNSEARILSNGVPRDLNSNASTDRPALVKQDDLLWGTSTVKEILDFTAKLRLPSTLSTEEKMERVQQLLADLELTHTANTQVGDEMRRGISGGEKKRVSIGVEMITDPNILFLDEPTSGLDASMALSVVRVLKKLVQKNKTVICTIHQPRYEIFKEFDKLMLMARGQVVYFGPTSDALEYFSKLGYTPEEFENPADFYLDLLHEVKAEEDLKEIEEGEAASVRVSKFIDTWSTLEKSKEISQALHKCQAMDQKPPKRKHGSHQYPSTFWQQYKALTVRNFQNSTRDQLLFIGAIIQYVVAGIVLSLIWFRLEHNAQGASDRIAYLNYSVLFLSFLSGFTYVVIFPTIRNIFNRESAAKTYSLEAFLLSLYTYEIPRQILLILVYTVITIYISNLKSTAASIFIYWFINFLTLLIGEALAVAVSAVSKSSTEANMLLSLVVYLWMFFTPFFASSVPKGLSWLSYTSFFRWSLEALLFNEFEGVDYNCGTTACPIRNSDVKWGNATYAIGQVPELAACQIPECVISTGDEWLRFFNVQFWSIGPYIGILVGTLIFFRLVTYLLLRTVRIGKM